MISRRHANHTLLLEFAFRVSFACNKQKLLQTAKEMRTGRNLITAHQIAWHSINRIRFKTPNTSDRSIEDSISSWALFERKALKGGRRKAKAAIELHLSTGVGGENRWKWRRRIKSRSGEGNWLLICVLRVELPISNSEWVENHENFWKDEEGVCDATSNVTILFVLFYSNNLWSRDNLITEIVIVVSDTFADKC